MPRVECFLTSLDGGRLDDGAANMARPSTSRMAALPRACCEWSARRRFEKTCSRSWRDSGETAGGASRRAERAAAPCVARGKARDAKGGQNRIGLHRRNLPVRPCDEPPAVALRGEGSSAPLDHRRAILFVARGSSTANSGQPARERRGLLTPLTQTLLRGKHTKTAARRKGRA